MTIEYLILSITLASGRIVNLRGHGIRFQPVNTKTAKIIPPIANGRVRLKSIRYRIKAKVGKFVKTGHFRHAVDCALTWAPGRKLNTLRSRCGKLFERVPLNDILDSRKFGAAKGVQFVA